MMNHRVATIYIAGAAAAGFVAGGWATAGSATVAIPLLTVTVVWLILDCAANIREKMAFYKRRIDV